MKIKSKIGILVLLSTIILLSGCNVQSAVDVLTPLPSLPTETIRPPAETPIVTAPSVETTTPENESGREDAQGNVVVYVTPLNLEQQGETLDFEISMDTHSVDLSMDLSQLASLTTDTGKTIQPLKWDAPMGGHHVSGVLSFQSSLDGSPFLEGAATIKLTLVNVDVPERNFTWELNGQ
jgi:hypothetical protein